MPSSSLTITKFIGSKKFEVIIAPCGQRNKIKRGLPGSMPGSIETAEPVPCIQYHLPIRRKCLQSQGDIAFEIIQGVAGCFLAGLTIDAYIQSNGDHTWSWRSWCAY